MHWRWWRWQQIDARRVSYTSSPRARTLARRQNVPTLGARARKLSPRASSSSTHLRIERRAQPEPSRLLLLEVAWLRTRQCRELEHLLVGAALELDRLLPAERSAGDVRCAGEGQ
jgi:hypothetical protein